MTFSMILSEKEKELAESYAKSPNRRIMAGS